MVWLSHLFEWKSALVMVQSATFICWYRQGFRWFWRWRSKPGLPALQGFIGPNHAKGIIACDFCVAVTATFRVLYVIVIIEQWEAEER